MDNIVKTLKDRLDQAKRSEEQRIVDGDLVPLYKPVVFTPDEVAQLIEIIEKLQNEQLVETAVGYIPKKDWDAWAKRMAESECQYDDD